MNNLSAVIINLDVNTEDYTIAKIHPSGGQLILAYFSTGRQLYEFYSFCFHHLPRSR
jgi:hypothetical protein